MNLKSRIEKLEQRRPPTTLLFVNEGETIAEARARAGMAPDAPVFTVRWQLAGEAAAPPRRLRHKKQPEVMGAPALTEAMLSLRLPLPIRPKLGLRRG